jgi:hypothetical protein
VHCLIDRTRQENTSAKNVISHEVSGLQRLQINGLTLNTIQLMQPNLRRCPANTRRETVLGKTLLQWHLAALKSSADFTA